MSTVTLTIRPKGEPNHEPITPHQVDADICDHFDVTVSQTDWFCDWYNDIGPFLASGCRGEELLSNVSLASLMRGDTASHRSRLQSICRYLEDTYILESGEAPAVTLPDTPVLWPSRWCLFQFKTFGSS